MPWRSVARGAFADENALPPMQALLMERLHFLSPNDLLQFDQCAVPFILCRVDRLHLCAALGVDAFSRICVRQAGAVKLVKNKSEWVHGTLPPQQCNLAPASNSE